MSGRMVTRWRDGMDSWVVVVALLGLVIVGLLPPGPRPADADPSLFSAERALGHIAEIAAEPHPMGSAEIELVREYLLEQLETLDGLEVQTQTIEAQDYYEEPGRTVSVTNIMARIAGTDATGAVALVAHYDSVPSTPGANDDAAGVATLLETARALLASGTLRNDVILLFTDGEEPQPRPGSNVFVTDHPWASEVGLVVNFEALGGAGPSMLVETSGPGSWLIGEYAKAVDRPAAFSYASGVADLLGPVGTDFDPFKAAGVPGLSFAYLHDSTIYHTMADDVDRVGLASLQHHGENALSIAQHFGELDLTNPPGVDAVHFSLFGRILVRHPTTWLLPVVVISALGMALGVARRMHRHRRAPLAMLRGASIVLGVGIAGSIVAFGAWSGLAGLRPTMGVLESYLWFAGLMALVLLGSQWVLRRRGVRASIDSGGAVLVWWLFALAGALAAPKIGYLFVWPCLAAVAAFAWEPVGRVGRWIRLARLALVAAPAVLLVLPAVDTFLQFAQPRPGNPDSDLMEAISLSALFVVLLAALLGPFLRDGQASQPLIR